MNINQIQLPEWSYYIAIGIIALVIQKIISG